MCDRDLAALSRLAVQVTSSEEQQEDEDSPSKGGGGEVDSRGW